MALPRFLLLHGRTFRSGRDDTALYAPISFSRTHSTKSSSQSSPAAQRYQKLSIFEAAE
jgi:hypothetical protein